MTLMLCIKCRKKQLSSSSDSDTAEDNETNNNNSILVNESNVDTVDFVSSSQSTVFNKNKDTIYISNNQQAPIFTINNDGSIRIKSNSINRALPDIPTNLNTLVINNEFINNSSPKSNGSILNSSLISEITNQNVTNISINSEDVSQSSNLVQSSNVFSTSSASNRDNTINNLDIKDFSTEYKHSYARIKNNIVVDSSTENDTDDYYDSGIINKKSNHTQKTTINILFNSNQNIHNTNLENPVSSSLYAVSRLTNLELPYFVSNLTHRNINLLEADVQSSESQVDKEPIKEVSYNKISVREPLSKVLAERVILEHHYTEVYEENNSYYEEISGSTNSSVTYTKIGESDSKNQVKTELNDLNLTKKLSKLNEKVVFNQIPPPKTPPPPPPVENLLNNKHSSRSTSPIQSTSTANIFNLDNLYTQVNKLAKQNKKNSVQPNINDLYAKIQKNIKIKVPELAFSGEFNKSSVNELNDSLKLYSNFISKKIHSSTPEIYNKDFIVNTIQQTVPPPLPPLDNIPKCSKLTSINYQKIKNLKESNSINSKKFFFINPHNLNHKRSLSTGNSNKITDINIENVPEDPNYEICTSKIENHSYEILKKSDINQNLKKGFVESGYEIINYLDTNTQLKDSDSDSPCYETIAKQNDDNEYISEPDYEVIKNNNLKNLSNFKTLILRKESDVSTEPGYERIRFISKKNIIDKCNENYESIKNEKFLKKL